MTARTLADAEALTRRFVAEFGDPPDGVWAAPGRVNLIGEHVDYSDGLVLPFALAQRTYVAARRRTDRMLSVRSVQRPDGASVDVRSLAPGSVTGWTAYVAGVVWVLLEQGHDVPGLDVLVDGHVPPGAGLSSSAAVECATAVAVADLAGADLSAAELAVRAQRSENEFVGVPCGLMDQMASMACTAAHALLFDVRSGSTEQVPFAPADAGLAVLVMDTKVQHSVGEGGYADRRRACEQAAEKLGVPALRDVRAASLDASLAALPRELRPRVRHVVREIARVEAAAQALGRRSWHEVGELMTASHLSLRDDFDVSCAELDVAVGTALALGALGARMTGAGFGGSAIALVRVDDAPAVAVAVADSFSASGFAPPEFFTAEPSDGAGREL